MAVRLVGAAVEGAVAPIVLYLDTVGGIIVFLAMLACFVYAVMAAVDSLRGKK